MLVNELLGKIEDVRNGKDEKSHVRRLIDAEYQKDNITCRMWELLYEQLDAIKHK